jgi:signal transduction histidine kinase/ActR/RegA family two-component response regulator
MLASRLFEASPGCHVALSPALEILAVTDEYLRITGTTRTTLVLTADVRDSLARALATRAPHVGAVEKRGARYLRPVSTPICDEAGTVRWLVHTIEDVTDREAARALRRITAVLTAELDLDALVQRITDEATALCRAQIGNFLYVSGGTDVVHLAEHEGSLLPGMPRGAKVSSYLAVPVIARSGPVLGGLYFGHAEPRWFTATDVELVVALAAQAAVAIDNARLYKEARASRQRAIESEDRLRVAVESAELGTWDFSPITGAFNASERSKELFGLPPDARPDWSAFLERVRADDGELIRRAAEWALDPASGGDLAIEFRVAGPNRVERWISTRGRVVFEQGRAVRFSGTCLDITERRRADAERMQLLQRAQAARAEAESANRAKDEFLAMLGHELRNPLAPIVTALELMKLRSDESSTKEQRVIERQVQHLTRLVDDLLDVSRITRGKIQLKKEPIELSEIVAKAVEIASPLFEQRRHNFVVEVPREGLLLEADEVRLAQVLANLLTNAAKYTEPGGHIELKAGRQGAEIVIRARDDGIGIPRDILPRIFNMFVQGERSVDRSEGGLGIGLTLVRSLVHMHGGSVIALSEGAGHGAEFVVRLPALPPRKLRAMPAKSPTPRTGTQAIGESQRILIVDDNADAAELLGEILRAVGHEVAIAHDGPQALGLIERFAPDVAVLDIGLPVMDGYELAGRLVAVCSAPPRLMAVTGYGQDHDRARSTQAGFERHFVKPVDAELLIGAIGTPASPRTAAE